VAQPARVRPILGLELSLAYKQRLLVVMPDGFGFNWPGHSTASAYRLLARIPIGTDGGALLSAAQTVVRKLANAGGVKLPSSVSSRSAAGLPPGGTGNSGGPSAPGRAATIRSRCRARRSRARWRDEPPNASLPTRSSPADLAEVADSRPPAVGTC